MHLLSKSQTRLRYDKSEAINMLHLITLMLKYCYLQKKLCGALTKPIESLFENDGKDTWASIRKLLAREVELATSELSSAVFGYELDQDTVDTMMQNLSSYARHIVENKAREEAGKVLIRMKDR